MRSVMCMPQSPREAPLTGLDQSEVTRGCRPASVKSLRKRSPAAWGRAGAAVPVLAAREPGKRAFRLVALHRPVRREDGIFDLAMLGLELLERRRGGTPELGAAGPGDSSTGRLP